MLTRRADILIALAMIAIVAVGLVRAHHLKERDRHCSRGATLYDAEDFSQAIAAYTDAIGHDADCAVAFTNRASAHVGLGQLELALEDFDRALELDPHLAVAYRRRGLVHEQLGHPQLAEADRERAD